MASESASVQSKWMSRIEAAKYMRICARTFDTLVLKGGIPKYRIGGKLLFKIAEIDAYIENTANTLQDDEGESLNETVERVLR